MKNPKINYVGPGLILIAGDRVVISDMTKHGVFVRPHNRDCAEIKLDGDPQDWVRVFAFHRLTKEEK